MEDIPKNLQAYPGSGVVTLVWDEVENAGSYTVYWSTEPDVTAQDDVLPVVTGATATHPFLNNDITFYYRVAATVEGEQSDLSEEVSATPIAWSDPIAAAGRVNDVGWSGIRFVAVDDSGSVTPSDDGMTWGDSVSPAGASLRGIVWAGRFVVVGDSGTVLLSSDGVNWSSSNIDPDNSLYDVIWDARGFVAVGDRAGSDNELILHSTTPSDPDSWTAASSVPGTANPLYAIAWNSERYVATGANGFIMTSTDGDSWVEQDSGIVANALRGVVWAADRFVVVGDNGIILTSPDGITWTRRVSGVITDLSAVFHEGALYLAVGANGVIFSSADGITWTREFFPPFTDLYAVGGNGTRNVIGGGDVENGVIYTRPR
ncbi:MAG: hypothetical protein R6X15_00140 [Pseudomonadota bacterium]